MAKGFTLIEILVVVGLLSVLFSLVLFIGLPQYDQYVLVAEKDNLVDKILDCRSEALSTGENCGLKVFGNSYCLINSTSTLLCIDVAHTLPNGMMISGLGAGMFGQDGDFSDISNATTTYIKLTNNVQKQVVEIDQYGFVDGK